MNRTSIAFMILLAVSVLAVPARAEISLLEKGQLRYGESILDFNEQLNRNEEDFIVQFRIDTPSTNEIACIYNETEFYHARFYRGQCYYIERRQELPVEEVPVLFEQFGETYGETPEVTQSRDQHLWYARWMLKNREIELTAYSRTDELFFVSYTEFDPLLLGEALYVQEQEVQAGAVIDPITGRAQLQESTEGQEGQAEGDQDTEADDDDSEEAVPEDPVEEDDWY
ncbi:hypothetical protein JW859_07720 [bacterium]|nr:hypothetical protein [bacterium]